MQNLVSRKQAKLLDLKRYFTGKPCIKGHTDERITGSGTCVVCRTENGRIYDIKRWSLNKDKMLEKQRKQYFKFKDKNKQYRLEHYQNNRNKYLEYQKWYRQEFKGKCNAWKQQYKLDKIFRTPKWLTKDHKDQIAEFYIKAELLTKETGIEHQVDHIIPLRGRNVSGLHVPWNLQVLTYLENRSKSNKTVP